MGREFSLNKEIPVGDQIAEALARDLLSGVYRPGDILPTEVELSDRYGVSRASVRSGLQSLAAGGIVRRLVGQGTIARDFRDWNILTPTVTALLADHAPPVPELVHSIFEFRYTAEPLVAAIAARNSRARDLLAMEEAYDGMERCVEAGEYKGSSFTEHDVSFHVAIYRATHNAVWANMAHILRPAITLVVRESNETTEELRRTLERHRDLMEHIRLRDPERAFDAALRVMQLTSEELGIAPDFGGVAGRDATHPLQSLFRAFDRTEPGAAGNDP
ncbi:MAG: FadR/GntR family transcriptional regulator [Tropicimonas sp.]|uniref:FadR/GntR family transcriptional regulator n=1 Tax=Tropicimonas sp. TaxID=2067044 RepID=UPI003A87572B